jgi:hypothetical protein
VGVTGWDVAGEVASLRDGGNVGSVAGEHRFEDVAGGGEVSVSMTT